MIWPVLSLILVGFAIACPMTAVMRAVGLRLRALDSPGAKGHVKVLRPIPNTGGVAIFLAVAAPMLGGIAAVILVPGEQWGAWLPPLEQHLPRLGETLPTAIALLACLLALHLTGVVDDRRSLGPFIKLGVQVAAAAVMTIWFEVRLLELLGPAPSVLITIAWIVVITNAINFLDNMDGLAGGVSAIAASFLLAATLLNQQWFIAAVLALLVGGLIGFLVFNFPPAKIFMGDGGSLVIGFLLAVLTARTTFLHEGLGGGWYGVFMPVVVLAIPLYDFTSVTLIRLRQGKSPFVGDQQHFSHRLVERGLSKRGAVILIWALTAVTGVGGVSLGRLEAWQAGLVFGQTGLVILAIVILEHASRHAKGRSGASA
ncbi:MAG: undecaprenyl/decaprenyl-phosphate alpha-N-acetylglucosaminyl 1-phosphate transferase [Phycisphaeraceae bacterium]|nr:undecaprenyl/decaprenyl-phosphate alpha-N-acetylglucosaminyl 1-phosphate transferase [Phycisphaerales bacterium]QOJ18220.1 MAG: undecaprenyl/decaprenyl-phosphate alpha-N-acetylglucosaminyl 1-phosphate transferase [Phycisphaeraceae bacterium]